MTDIEQRAQRLLDDIQRRKQSELADQVFREPKRRAIEKANGIHGSKKRCSMKNRKRKNMMINLMQ